MQFIDLFTRFLNVICWNKKMLAGEIYLSNYGATLASVVVVCNMKHVYLSTHKLNLKYLRVAFCVGTNIYGKKYVFELRS